MKKVKKTIDKNNIPLFGNSITNSIPLTGSASCSNNLSSSLIYGNGYTSTWGSQITISTTPNKKFIILGDEIEVNGNTFDIMTPIIIASLNVLGKSYWIELKKQGYSLGDEIDSFIEERIIILDRDKKIDELLS